VYVLDLLGAKLSATDFAALLAALALYVPGNPGQRRYEAVTEDRARIAADGIWIDGRKLGELAQMIETISRLEIVEIRTPRHLTGSKPAAVIGAAAGVAIGLTISAGVASSDRPCGRCAPEKLLVFTAPVAAPVGFAWLGYHSNMRWVSDVIYRRY
jgi:hypothetical protein